MSSKTDPGRLPDKRKPEHDTVFMLLTSQRPSEVWRGTEQIRQWLKANINDREVYYVLLDAVKQNPGLREDARNILLEMMQLESEVAEEALTRLPTFIPDILAEADDAYYAAEYAKAIQLYQQVLRIDPNNTSAKEHLDKSLLKTENSEQPTDLPRSAKQFYWRARSYIAGKEIITAINLLNAAIEAAQAKGLRYPDAENELVNVQKISLAAEHLKKAESAISKGNRKDALAEYKTAQNLDPSNRDIRNQIWKQTFILSLSWLIPVVVIIGVSAYYYTQVITAAPITPTLPPEPVLSATATLQIVESTSTSAPIPSETATVAPLPTDTLSPSATFTQALTPTPQEIVLGNGFINKAVVSVWKDPNRNKIATVGLNQPLVLLELKFVSGSNWYRCRWDNNGTPTEGWILAEYITLAP